ncbi:2,4-diaminobutyrate 4-transaminase [Clostridium putrefaciens]|uniref:Diaminobutyrate--2-oxoglutarate transaminase n=1 Tax=Clostridium putrefaciens TaxID=99675 RepID=A0A381J7D2_9CLOT|nr:diaminobutyrate--2-oxoglutarate transaminase [Clostridium putrefaciens]SUY47141.1 2,4-diaminobutyrate 4-transaminase [Clostridium putrefaciens]
MTESEKYESNIRNYCRYFPKVFTKSKLCKMYTGENEEYLDFFCGAGALNYGHNNDYIMEQIVDYIKNDGITHALDMYTTTKCDFIKKFQDNIIKPRGYEYKMMFCGPTGTNANEAALKIARKHTGRKNVIAFMGAFHGMTLGSLSLTSSLTARRGAGVQLENTTFIPYCRNDFDSLGYIRMILNDDHSGIEKPAAIFVETIQGEGGVQVADFRWLKELAELCKEYQILLVCDEVQVGCGRTGTFFSFESAGIEPDMVVMSKSISGSGLPMSLVLLKPEIDCLTSEEHSGTFRGNQLAFVGASAAIDYAIEHKLWDKVKDDEQYVKGYIEENILPISPKIQYRGRGLIFGIDFSDFDDKRLVFRISQECFKRRLIIELSGRDDSVLKVMPALVIHRDELMAGLEIIRKAIQVCI